MKFADTSFWVALHLRRDQHHDVARRLWEARQGAILTSNHVIGETWTFLRRRAGHEAARALIEALQRSPSVALRHVDDRVEVEAWAWLYRHDERAYSFVDATSFALMRRLRITEALAFDGDFSAAGFVELRA